MNFSELPISCYIRTLNEERMIGEVISSAKKICNEVIVIDSLSIDKTKSISLTLGAKVIDQPWLGNGFQKRVGEDEAKNDWILDIDADEIVTDDMALEIKELFNSSKIHKFDALLTPIITSPPIGNIWYKFSRAWRVKLYNKKKVRIPAHKAWDQFKTKNLRIYNLNSGLLHFSFTGIEMHLKKLNSYSSMLSKEQKLKPLYILKLRIWFALPIYFLQKFIGHGLFRAGTYGFSISISSAIGRWLKDVKQFEIHKKTNKN